MSTKVSKAILSIALISSEDLKKMKKTYKGLDTSNILDERNKLKAMLLRLRINKKVSSESVTNVRLYTEAKKMIARLETEITSRKLSIK